MSFIVATAATVLIGSTIYQDQQNKKAVKEGRKQEDEDRRNARRAEVFAETEGQGIGELGKVSLEVDDDEELSNLSTSVRI